MVANGGIWGAISQPWEIVSGAFWRDAFFAPLEKLNFSATVKCCGVLDTLSLNWQRWGASINAHTIK
jgi:hypothetical protein